MKEFLDYMWNNEGLVDWVAIPDEFSDQVWDACCKGYVESFVETETYALTDRGRMFLITLIQANKCIKTRNA